MNYKYLFFDLDHTLWDYHVNSFRALEQLFTEFNLDCGFAGPREFSDTFNRHNDALWEAYRNGAIKKEELRYKRFSLTLGEGGITDTQTIASIGDLFMEITPKLNALFPNTLETLEYLLQRGYSMYILTNGFIKTQETKLTNAGLDKYFKRIFSSEEFGVNKPNKEIFHWAVSSLHAAKKQCLMIGDDEHVDVEGARKYGIDAIWFNTVSDRISKKAIQTISDLAELRDIL